MIFSENRYTLFGIMLEWVRQSLELYADCRVDGWADLAAARRRSVRPRASPSIISMKIAALGHDARGVLDRSKLL
jgi:hypothetical protein